LQLGHFVFFLALDVAREVLKRGLRGGALLLGDRGSRLLFIIIGPLFKSLFINVERELRAMRLVYK
jgi:hypothetical protein